MKGNQALKIVYSALFSALIFVGTQFIRIPLPFGYFNLGDCFIIMSAVIIGGPYAIISSAVGSVLADVLSGYAIYVPATIIIKPLMVIVMTAILKIRRNKGKKAETVLLIIGAAASELIMVCGYFIYDTVIYSFAGAIAALSGNVLQGFVAVVESVLIIIAFEHSNLFKHIKLQ